MNLVSSVIREYAFRSQNSAETTFKRRVDTALFNSFPLSDTAAVIDVSIEQMSSLNEDLVPPSSTTSALSHAKVAASLVLRQCVYGPRA
jgi:hypothetical protein